MVWDRNLDEDERSDRIKCRNNNMSEKWKVKSNTKPEFISSERELVEQNREVKVSSGVCFIHSSCAHLLFASLHSLTPWNYLNVENCKERSERPGKSRTIHEG